MYNTHNSDSLISRKVDKTQLCHRAKIKWDGDRIEKKVNVIFINNQNLDLGQLLTTSTIRHVKQVEK